MDPPGKMARKIDPTSQGQNRWSLLPGQDKLRCSVIYHQRSEDPWGTPLVPVLVVQRVELVALNLHVVMVLIGMRMMMRIRIMIMIRIKIRIRNRYLSLKCLHKLLQ